MILSLARCSLDWDVPSTASELDGDDASSANRDAAGDSAADANSQHDANTKDAGDASTFDANLPIVDVDASCSTSVRCASGSYCRYADQECGAVDKTGVCTENQTCTVTSPGATAVCSCSGAVYPSACAARTDGQDVSASATCTAPSSTFQCGYAFCPTSDFCVANEPTDGSAPHFSCASFNGCLLPGCGCAAPTAAAAACDGGCAGALLDLGAVEVTCH